MAKNRYRKHNLLRAILKLVPKPIGIGFVVVVSLALIYLYMGHKCSQYGEEIKRLEDQYTELENERVREDTRWIGMKTADQLDALLVRNGMLMVYPNAAQIVRVSGASRKLPSSASSAQAAAPDTARGAVRVAGRSTGR